MKTFTIQHRFCGQTKEVTGIDFWAACRNASLEPKFWKVV